MKKLIATALVIILILVIGLGAFISTSGALDVADGVSCPRVGWNSLFGCQAPRQLSEVLPWPDGIIFSPQVGWNS